MDLVSITAVLCSRHGCWAFQGIPKDKRHDAVEEKIDEMGLRQYCDRPAGGYSGGNKRKLSVAIAMIGDPQVPRKI